MERTDLVPVVGVGERNRAARERFEELVVEALDTLPDWVADRMENVEVLVEDRPPPGEPGLLGRYEGIPLTERNAAYTFTLPDRISLYRSTLERHAPGDDALREAVRHTVIHEIAHHFGISDDRLREIDRY